MKAYYYTAKECGLDKLPDGPLALDDARIPRTTDPSEADVFVCPVMIHHMGSMQGRGHCDLTKLKRLPYLNGNESRHVFWNVGDTFLTELPPESIAIRCDATKDLKRVNPRTHCLPWPAPNASISGKHTKRFDVSFIGWASTEMTKVMCESCLNAGLRCDIELHDWFYGYVERDDPQRAKAAWERYTQSLSQSIFALSPRSIPEGVIRYRFFEAMSAGVIPVLAGDGTLLPFDLPWDRLCIQIPERDINRTGEILKQRLSCPVDIASMSHWTRKAWENHIDSRHWREKCTDIVLAEMGDE